MASNYDAIVVGSGPNGLAAAITLAQAGLSVAVYEAKDSVGGGMRSASLTLPGFTHDICSAIHPLALGSPFFQTLQLEKFGLEWIQPDAPMVHPFDDGSVAMLWKSIESSASTLGVDAYAYTQLMQPLADRWELLQHDILGPLHIPKHPLLLMQFAWHALRSAENLCHRQFTGSASQAFFAGLAAHSILPLTNCGTAAFGLVLATLGHAVGWPLPRGGSQRLADALVDCFKSYGGKIYLGTEIKTIQELPKARLIFMDVTPKQFLAMAEGMLPSDYVRRMKTFKYGPGVYKIDWALSDPIPWRAKECSKAGTVHLGGSFDEIADSEKKVWQGELSSTPFVILAQPSLWDPSRAPAGKHTAWGYCHVPNGSLIDATEHIEKQIERFAPGFRDCIIARHTMNTAQLEMYNPNYVGGDINGGAQDLTQLYTRPIMQLDPYATALNGVYLCSASTPPGGGVHGMCGYHAAKAALAKNGAPSNS